MALDKFTADGRLPRDMRPNDQFALYAIFRDIQQKFIQIANIINNPGSVVVDLAYTPDTDEGVVTNTAGTDATIPSFDDTNAGLAPGSGGGTTNFLRADGTWAAPSAGGAVVLNVNDQTGTSYALDSADLTGSGNAYIRMTNSSANTVTLTAEASLTGLLPGATVTVLQGGTGQTSFVADTGVTINTPETLKCRKRWAAAVAIYVGSDVWDLNGDLELA